MTILKRSVSLILSLASTGSLAQVDIPKVVYGLDNRVEVYEAPSALQTVAQSTAAMIPMTRLKLNVTEGSAARTFTALQSKLKDSGVCADDRFADQPVPGMCSGFLVGPDLLVTAGHCVRTLTSCQSNAWVFGFAVDGATHTAGVNIPAENVYRCRELVNQKLNTLEGTDHALIRLDRVVTGVAPLTVRTAGKIEDATDIVVIGHPMGLPTKVADGAKVRTNTHAHYFVANLDTFGGNSGSVVVNGNDMVVEGILVRGETDYKYNVQKGCQEVYQCDDDKCRGEDVTRITDVIELTQREAVLAAAQSGNATLIAEYLKKKGWVNIYDNNGIGMLARAALGQQAHIVNELLAVKVDVSAVDLKGRTPLHFLAMTSGLSAEGESVAETLAAAGVKLDAQTEDTLDTALHGAVRSRNVRLVEILLKAGANPKLLNSDKKMPIDLTDWFNLKQRKIRSLLSNAMKGKV
jgi:V8-like Glu-specific endopeptidase